MEMGRYSVMSSYGYWDEKNIQFSNEGFQIILIADGGATHASHQFYYSQSAVTFVFRLGREEGKCSNEEVWIGQWQLISKPVCLQYRRGKVQFG